MSTDDSSRQAAPAVPVVAAPARRRRVAVWLAGVAASVVALLALAIGAVFWSAHHATGSAWLLGLVPGLTVVEPRGSLIGDFAATRVVYAVGGAGELRLDAPRWHALAATRGDHGRWLHLMIDTLHADRVVWVANKSAKPAGPATPPASLRLPVEIEVREASVDELRIGALDAMPVRGVHARVHLGADGGALHRLDALAAAIERGDARGAFAIGADAPFAVDASVDAVASAKDWSATARAHGPLASLDTSATARVAATATHAAQSLDARAVIHPFAAWPLGELSATASGLDLSAFASALPATALTGRAIATTSGIDVPATVSIELANQRAGRWNEGLLPVRELRAELRARPENPNVVDVQTLSAELGSTSGAGGSVVARGRWTPATWNIDAELRQVRPIALDARAGDAVVSGKATLAGSGFAGAPAIPGPASAATSSAAASPRPASPSSSSAAASPRPVSPSSSSAAASAGPASPPSSSAAASAGPASAA
ncbi:MAG TPA: hypothetical protein VGO85_00895, partial [Caldimonas sp.]|nr:hypothetical protein [Caldimonas sp.]